MNQPFPCILDTQQLGEEHLRTKESAEHLKQLTEQAVMSRRRLGRCESDSHQMSSACSSFVIILIQINQMTAQPAKGRSSGGMAVSRMYNVLGRLSAYCSVIFACVCA